MVNLRLRLGLTQGQRLGSLISEPSRRTNRGEGNEAITGGGGGLPGFYRVFFLSAASSTVIVEKLIQEVDQGLIDSLEASITPLTTPMMITPMITPSITPVMRRNWHPSVGKWTRPSTGRHDPK